MMSRVVLPVHVPTKFDIVANLKAARTLGLTGASATTRSTAAIKGAVYVPRGMLEFRADPESPYHNPALRKEKTAVLYCASGGRSALAGKTLQELGYKSVYNAGAFKDLAEAGLETEPA
jgi:rhodanese-related sulfurtransferase